MTELSFIYHVASDVYWSAWNEVGDKGHPQMILMKQCSVKYKD